MKHAYISCPMTVSQAVLDEVIQLVKYYHVDPIYWKKGTSYNEESFSSTIKTCDAFIVILPDLSWSYDIEKMTSGSRKELIVADRANKPIYLAYRTKLGDLGIYSALVEAKEVTSKDNSSIGFGFSRVSGLASTKYNFRDNMSPVNLLDGLPGEFEPNLKKKQREQAATNAISRRQQAANLGGNLHEDFNRDDSSWLKHIEELIRQGYNQQLEKAIFPAWIDISAIPQVDFDKFINYFKQTGFIPIDTGIQLGIITPIDNRIVLFF